MFGSPAYYLPGANVPKIFQEADRQMNEAYPEPEIVTEPIEVPMPFIEGAKGVKGPLIITKDWYIKCKKKELAKLSVDLKNVQIEIMQMIAERDRLRYKIGQLDPSKKKDAMKIAALNVKLRDTIEGIDALCDLYEINLNTLDEGSKLGRFVGKLKKIYKKVRKKVKRFYKDNKELIVGIASIVIPAVLAAVVKKLLGFLGV